MLTIFLLDRVICLSSLFLFPFKEGLGTRLFILGFVVTRCSSHPVKMFTKLSKRREPFIVSREIELKSLYWQSVEYGREKPATYKTLPSTGIIITHHYTANTIVWGSMEKIH